MPDVLMFSDTVHSAELRHEVPVTVGDPLLYVERNGERHIVVPSFEIPVITEAGDYAFHPFEEFGVDELRRTSSSPGEMIDEIVVRAVRSLGVERAIVPPSFPVLTADRLRAAGIELTPDREAFVARRRVKSPAELEGIRRAQRAAQAGMEAARELLSRASANGSGALELDGDVLTCERLKAAISSAFLVQGATWDEFVTSHGAQSAIGHHLGSGEIRSGETVVIDVWPQDPASSCFADMTRTFVVGEIPDEVAAWHRLCREALDRVLEATRPGVTGLELYGTACDVFEEAGFPTMRTKIAGETLDEGFHHALGHGVGLEVHEMPILNLLGHDPLVAGDVIAVEPGLYRPGFGGLRLEDLLLVTDDGCENLTRFPYELAPS